MLATTRDARYEVDEVLAWDDRIIAFSCACRGTHIDGGGTFEIAHGVASVVEGGLVRRLERYEPEDRAGVLARYAELGGHQEVLGDRPPERVLTDWLRWFNARDLDGMLACFAENHVRVDHRPLAWEDVSWDTEGAMWESWFATSPDARVEIDEVLACDDRVIAYIVALRGTAADGGGSFELAFGCVVLVEDGRAVRSEVFDIDDRQAMIARYTELGGGLAALGDRPPERFWVEWARRWARRDLDALFDLVADDYVMADHQKFAWTETDKPSACGVAESMWSASADLRAEVDEVLACDERMLAYAGAFRGHSVDGGGAFEIANTCVYVVENGLLHSIDAYAPDDREAALVRFAELTGRTAVLGDRPSERVVARLCRRWTTVEVDALADLFTDDVVRIDHRTLGYDEAHGHEGIRKTYAAMLEVSAEVHMHPEEVLACDDRVVALRATLRGTAAEGGGEFATPCGYLFVVADGRVQRLEQFEADDRQTMLTRFAELGGGQGPLDDRPSARWAAEFLCPWASRDVGGLRDLYSEDYRLIDHRTLGWGEVDKAGVRPLYESFFAAASDVWGQIDEVLACGDRVIAYTFTLHGRSDDGGGPFEIPFGIVAASVNGLRTREYGYQPEDRDAMIAQFAELGGGLGPLGDRPPERSVARSLRCMASRDVDGLMDLHADDYQRIDHRALGWGETTKDRQMFASFFASASDLWWQFDEVLACDDRVIAGTCTLHGRSNDGGGRFEMPFGVVLVVENGLRTREHLYEPDDRQAMLAKFAELGGGQAQLGDRPPERYLREWCRRFATADLDRIAELYTEDFRRVDHRVLAWEVAGQADERPLLESFFTTGCDLWAQVSEVLACDDRVIAYTFIIHGRHRDGGGTFEIPFGVVAVIENGLACSTDLYAPDDLDAMLARFAELSREP